jgi:hypothetical protein
MWRVYICKYIFHLWRVYIYRYPELQLERERERESERERERPAEFMGGKTTSSRFKLNNSSGTC